MNKKVALHFLGIMLTAAAGAVVDVLTGSHKVWAPIAVALLTDVKPLLSVIGGQPPPAAPAVLRD